MKKIISIILIITMLLSMVAMTVPAVAADGEGGTATNGAPTLSELGIDIATGAEGLTKPEVPAVPETPDMTVTHVGADGNKKAPVAINISNGKVTNVGNVVINDSNRAAYVSSLPEGAKGVTTWDELKSATATNAYIYLKNDITIASGKAHGGSVNGKTGMVIDGCGYTIKIENNYSLFEKTKDITLKNITIDGAISNIGTTTWKFFHVLNRWEGPGYVNLTNVTFSVDFTIWNKDSSSYTGVVGKGNEGGTWDNVLNEGAVTVKGDTTRFCYLSGMVGSTKNATYNSVVNAGTYTVEGICENSDYIRGIGGITGEASNSKFTNCYNLADIKISNLNPKGVDDNPSPAEGSEDLDNAGFGGLVGSAKSSCVFTNCANTGNLIFSANATTKVPKLGGIVGFNDAGNLYGCYNSGNITIEKTVDGVAVNSIGGLVGYTKAGNIGAANSGNTWNGCLNTGTITIKSTVKDADINAIGGVLGDVYKGGAKIDNCFSTGKIVIESGADFDTAPNVGGIVGRIRWGSTIKNSVFCGSIQLNAKTLAVGGILGHTSNDTNIENCHVVKNAKNDLTIDINAPAERIGAVVGNLGPNSNVRNSSNYGDILVNKGCSQLWGLGGIVGRVFGQLSNGSQRTGSVVGCYNEGDITVHAESALPDATRDGIGGIVGYADAARDDGNAGALTVDSCWNAGNITINKYLQRPSAGIVASNTMLQITIKNCLNTGAITGKSGHTSNHTQTAGILGLTYKEVSRAVSENKFVKVMDCTNLGIISDSNTDKLTVDGKKSVSTVAGIVANVRGVPDVTIYNCVNGSPEAVAEGEVAPGTITGGVSTDSGWSGVAGIIALYGSVGDNWMMNGGKVNADDGCFLTVEKVINYAPISGKSGKAVGSIYGSHAEIALSNPESKMLFKDCVNAATITNGLWGVGGVLNVVDLEFMELVECANIGTVAPTTGGQKIGGVVGVIQKPIKVIRCVNAGEVVPYSETQHQFVGGITGAAEAEILFEDCVNLADICPTGKGYDSGGGDGDQGVGGIVGYHSHSHNITLDGCKNYGKIYQTGMPSVYGIGGMIGTITKDNATATLINCENNGTIEIDNVHGTVKGVHGAANFDVNKDNGRQTSQGAGGMVGSVRFGAKLKVIGCTNNGLLTVTENGGYYNMGGIIGTVYKNTSGYVTVEGCVNNGDVVIDSTKGSEMHGAGGIVGRLTLSTKTTISDCVNNGDLTVTDEAYDYNLGGILASANRSVVDIFNCHNTGNMKLRDRNTDKANNYTYSYNAAAGILGYAYSNGYEGAQDVHIESCSNSGKIYNYDAENNPGWVAGIAGILRSTSYAELINCVNTGDITSVKSMTGGMTAWVGTVGLSWAGTHTSEILFQGCYNSGNIQGTSAVGGMLGGMNEYDKSDKVSDHKISFIECVNDGNVSSTGNQAGGIMSSIGALKNDCGFELKAVRCVNRGDVVAGGDAAGGIIGYIGNGISTASVTVSQCVNEGLVSAGFGKKADGTMNSGGNAGGIFGTIVATDSTIAIGQSANYGVVKAHNWNTAGILGQVNNSGKEFANQMVSIKNCVNLGRLESDVAGGSKEDPITFSANKLDNNAYVKTTVEKDYNKFTVVSEADAKKMAEKFTFFVSDVSALDSLIAQAKAILDNADAYDAGTIADLRVTYADALNLCEQAPIGVAKNNGVYKMYVANATNIKNAIDALSGTEGVGGVVAKGQIWKALEMAIADADKFVEENTTAYDVNAWNEFVDHLTYCRKLVSSINVNDEANYDTMNDAMRTLRAIIKNLKGNNEVQGKVIFTADELVLLEGSNANFYLGADITVTKPVKSFGGNLFGNGYDIVLAGSALFEEFKAGIPTGEYVFTAESFSELCEGSINSVTVVGDAGAANSVFGKVTGSVTVKDVVVDVPALKVAAIFHASGDHADVVIENVLTNAKSEYALLGDINGEVEIKNVISMGGAESFVGQTDAFKATTAYLDGVTYYNDNSDVSLESIASGEVAYIFNQKLATLASNNDNFGDYYLVQNLTAGTKPSFGKPNANQDNLVVYDSTAKKYVNAIKNYYDDTVVIPELDKTVPPVYTMLKSALARAGVLVEADYTAESWLLLKSAIEAGNAALGLTDQDAIDEAVAVLNVIMASMEKKSTSIDYSALVAALDEAAKLVRTDYTAGSWSTFQAILTMAKIARLADTQAAVDSAVASLKSAVDGLVKLEAPVEDPSDKPSEEEPGDDEPVAEPAGLPIYVIIAIAAGALLIIAAACVIIIVAVKKKKAKGALGEAVAEAIDAE